MRLLAVLHAIVALNAFGGGCYGLAGADGVPLEWLAGTPFTTYLVPSAILVIVVGGSQAAASVQLLRHAPNARLVSAAASVVLLGWIATQLLMIGFVSWLQPAVAATATISLVGLGLGIPRGRPTV